MKKIYLLLMIIFSINIQNSFAEPSSEYSKGFHSPDKVLHFISSEYNKSFKLINNAPIEMFGYYFQTDKSTQLSCSDNFIKGNLLATYYTYNDKNKYILRNITLEKAKDDLANFIKGSSINTSVLHLYAGLTELMINGLKNIEYIKEHFKYFAENYYGSPNEIYEYGIEDKNRSLINLALNIANIDIEKTTVNQIVELAEENGFLDLIAYKQGIFDIYNDGFYEKVEINKINEYSILAIYEDIIKKEETKNVYPRYYKLLSDDNNSSTGLDYPLNHCTNNVYAGHLYIVPYNNKTYIVNATENEHIIKKVEMKNTVSLNTDYSYNYYIDDLFRNNEKEKLLHGITQLGTFAGSNYTVYEKIFDREPLSPLGDVDKVKDRFDENKLMGYEEVKAFLRGKKPEKIKDSQDLSKYIAELQKDITLKLPEEVYFLNIAESNKDAEIIAVFYSNDNSKKYYFPLDKKLQFLDKNVITKIDEFINRRDFYKSIITNHGSSSYIAYISKDNKVLVINIENGKIGMAESPLYYYKSEQVIENDILDTDSTNILKDHFFDCLNNINAALAPSNIYEIICSSRPLLTYNKYIELLFNKKIKEIESGIYPIEYINYYNNLQQIMQNTLEKCNTIDCIENIFIKYERFLLH